MSHKWTFIIRQLGRSSKLAGVCVLCMALSLMTLTALSGFGASVNQALRDDARTLHAADIIIRSYDKITPGLKQAIDKQIALGAVQLTRYLAFYSVIRTMDDRHSLLAALKVVEPGYPFYGKVRLASKRDFHEVLAPGQAIAEQTLLDRLGLRVGDKIHVGYAVLKIADVVLSEPDRPLNVFALGPRLFVDASDLESLGLTQSGSRIRHVYLLKVLNPDRLDELAGQFKKAAQSDQESVDTYKTARSGVKRLLDNFIFFLRLVSIFVLVVAGIGIQGTLTAFLREKEATIAIMKTVGGTNRYIAWHFIRIALVLTLAGTALGLVAGYAVQRLLTLLLAAFLPPNLNMTISWGGVLEGVGVGLGVVALFTFLPLYRIRQMRPLLIFRRERLPSARRWSYYGFGLLLALVVCALMVWHMQDLRLGLYGTLVIGGLIAAATLFTQLLLMALKRWPINHLAMRQAVRGLFRKGQATCSVMVTLTVSLCVIYAISLIEKNLDADFIQSFPADAPNLFFIDIQTSQKAAVAKALDHQTTFYPIIRARVAAINGQPIQQQAERRKRRDNLGRVFNLTYRQNLLADEKIVQGGTLFDPQATETQVSVLDRVLEMHPMAVGDTITFKIQGVPLKARISSIRTRTKKGFSPFFYFVFQEKTLQQAPQSLFTALKVPAKEVGPLQSRITARFPNISVIDLSAALRIFTRLVQQLSNIIRLFTLLSVLAGLLILISAVFATRDQRILESVYFKILGARKVFIYKVFTLENILIGVLSGSLGLSMAQLCTYYTTRFIFHIDYHPFWGACLIMLAATLMLIAVTGLAASGAVLRKKPIVYLREQPDG